MDSIKAALGKLSASPLTLNYPISGGARSILLPRCVTPSLCKAACSTLHELVQPFDFDFGRNSGIAWGETGDFVTIVTIVGLRVGLSRRNTLIQ